MRIRGRIFVAVFSILLATTGITSAAGSTDQCTGWHHGSTPPPAESLRDLIFASRTGRPDVSGFASAYFSSVLRPPKGAPNVLLILPMTRALGSSVSSRGVPSPNMEKLAAQGLRYTRSHDGVVFANARGSTHGRDHHMAGTGVITS